MAKGKKVEVAWINARGIQIYSKVYCSYRSALREADRDLKYFTDHHDIAGINIFELEE